MFNEKVSVNFNIDFVLTRLKLNEIAGVLVRKMHDNQDLTKKLERQ